MNAGAITTHEQKKWKSGILGTAASFAVLDPGYALSVPPTQLLSGAFDTLSHAEKGLEALSDFIRECSLPTRVSQLQSKVDITPQLPQISLGGVKNGGLLTPKRILGGVGTTFGKLGEAGAHAGLKAAGCSHKQIGILFCQI